MRARRHKTRHLLASGIVVLLAAVVVALRCRAIDRHEHELWSRVPGGPFAA